ncbi:hypothetical protein [Brachybacterium kimchii]|uniref:Uncharacterized protein n=1 Tax=Brachybacterium kimchii TaxID=2942909 RepID=A0ABY4N7L3_9MICO|nr:hypothetical protein [Brachybacterium kimchii]UQN30539.1 hypothetical protein M4486_04300 [Brachybacterium kimchii]
MTPRIRLVIIIVALAALLGGALWFALARGGNGQDDPKPTGVAVLPSDQGGENPSDGGASDQGGEDEQPKPTGDFTDPEQVATAFADSYPGDVKAISDATFQASLKGTDSSLAKEISNPRVEQDDHGSDDIYETYAYTIYGTYKGEEIPAYSITVARPVDAEEGDEENDTEYRVQSFDWTPQMLGDEDSPGPAADVISPISSQQRIDLASNVRKGALAQTLVYKDGETAKERKDRLADWILTPTKVKPEASPSGRYGYKPEILSQVYTTEDGGPITIGYTGRWIDPYDQGNTSPADYTVTIVRDKNGKYQVKSIEETKVPKNDGGDE